MALTTEQHEQLEKLAQRDAMRRPHSRFAAGVVTPHDTVIHAIDELVLELLMLKRKLRDDQ